MGASFWGRHLLPQWPSRPQKAASCPSVLLVPPGLCPIIQSSIAANHKRTLHSQPPLPKQEACLVLAWTK